MAKFDKKLSAILVKAGLLSEEATAHHQETADRDDTTLSKAVIASGAVSESDMLGAVANEVNVPPVDLDRVAVPDRALELLPEELARYYGVIPLARIGDMLTLAVTNPFDILVLDDVKITTGCELQPMVTTDVALERNLDRLYTGGEKEITDFLSQQIEPEIEHTGGGEEEEAEEEAVDIAHALAAGKDSPVVKLVNLLVFEAIKQHASDIHIEPFEKYLRVRYRIDGNCQETMSPPRRMLASIVSRVKILAGLDIAERRTPQDGKFQLRVEGRQVDFRVSTLPMVHGEKVCIRILDSSNLKLNLDDLGFEQKSLDDFRYAINLPYGMILVTGPTGSGKSTTLYSAVKEVLCIEENITTVEDPVEYQLDGVNQVPVSEKRGLTFAAALRSILRQDPDTVMIGEIRDRETVEIAVKAALTGHLVFSTLHTNDAPSTVTRMIDMGVDPFMVASATRLVAAQRLARRLADTKVPVDKPPAERLREFGLTEEEIEGDWTLYGPAPGEASGFKGRFALLETMPITAAVSRIIIDGGSALDIREQALKDGMITLRRAGILNMMRGKSSLDQIMSVTMAD